jgi:Ribonuclease G/E
MPCPACSGAGRLQSPETSLLKAYRELVRQGERLRGADVRLTLHPELSAALHQEAREGLLQLARLLGARVQWIERADTPRHAVVMDIQLPGQASATA